MPLDLAVLEKYERAGPRYTSYPTALQFVREFNSAEFCRAIADSNRGEGTRDLSLYFHFPFCESLCYFCGCHMMITRNCDSIEEYLFYMKKEIDLLSGLVSSNRKVVQIHWGGGTPTYLTTEQIEEMAVYIKRRFDVAENAEVGIEIDPRRMTARHLPTIRESGFNRVSFGIQDFDETVQKAVNRIQPEYLTREVVEKSRELGFESINVDLIYGLPFQTVESFEGTIDKIIDIRPSRIAVFNYAHVPWLKKHQRLIPESALPSVRERLRILELVIDRLTGAGYIYIGMDHFAEPDDDLSTALANHSLRRNFQGYCTHSDLDILGVGVSSISELEGVYAQNTKSLTEYKTALDMGRIPTAIGYRLHDDDHLRRYVIQGLMCSGKILKQDIKAKFGVDFDRYFPTSLRQLESLVKDGLVTTDANAIRVSDSGRLVIRNIAMVFDRYLVDTADVHSRTV